MNVETLPFNLYFVVMGLATVGWLALIIFPRSRRANFWFSGLVVPLLLCLLYMYLLLTYWFRDPPGNLLQFLTLKGVMAMLANPGLMLVAWINIVAMDLVVGAWMARKAAQIRMPYVYLLPCLILTFVFAGFGFTLFAIIAGIGGGWSEIAKFEGKPPTNTEPVAARPDVARAT
jgi:Domain of unknown function (DUF4281)